MPLPGWLLVACSLVVIGACAIAEACVLALTWLAFDRSGGDKYQDPVEHIAFLALSTFVLAAMALGQYRGTFRRNARAAGHTSAWLLLVGYIGTIGCLVGVAESGHWTVRLWSFVGLGVALAVGGSWPAARSSWSNHRGIACGTFP